MYRLYNKSTKNFVNVSLENILEEINRDRSNDWRDYNESDWREGLTNFTEYILVDDWLEEFNIEFWKITTHTKAGRSHLQEIVNDEGLGYIELKPKEAAEKLHREKYCKGASIKVEDNCWCFPF